ncbi:MAG: PQQ-binding-like beta-propeller repeat protein [Pseudomonadota bacterium]
MGRGAMIFAGSRGRVVALDPATGDTVWQTRLEGGRFGHLKNAHMSIVEHGDALIVGANGYVLCLDTRDGRERWRHDIEGAGQDWVAMSVAGRAGAPDTTMLDHRGRAGSGGALDADGDGDGGGGGGD